MRKATLPVLIFLTALALPSLACQRLRAGDSAPQPPYVRRSMSINGIQRSYDIWVPETLDPAQPAPLVMVLHGGGGNSEQVCQRSVGVAQLAESEGFVVVCPSGVEGHWNDGRKMDDYRAQREHVDDVAFLKAVVEAVAAETPIDSQRVYVTGLSNGGMMTLRLVCEAGDTFAAAAAVIANLPADLDCQPQRPMPLLIMNGTQDPLMPWGGGQVHFLRRELGPVLSTPATVAHFAGAFACVPQPNQSRLPDIDPADGTRVDITTFSGCSGGASVVEYAVDGGGHTLPGGDQYAPAFLIGRVSRDINGAQTIWNFLSDFTKP